MTVPLTDLKRFLRTIEVITHDSNVSYCLLCQAAAEIEALEQNCSNWERLYDGLKAREARYRDTLKAIADYRRADWSDHSATLVMLSAIQNIADVALAVVSE